MSTTTYTATAHRVSGMDQYQITVLQITPNDVARSFSYRIAASACGSLPETLDVDEIEVGECNVEAGDLLELQDPGGCVFPVDGLSDPAIGIAIEDAGSGHMVPVVRFRSPFFPEPMPEDHSHCGGYDHGAVYRRGDVVVFDGAEYVSTGSSRNIPPPSHCWVAIAATPAVPIVSLNHDLVANNLAYGSSMPEVEYDSSGLDGLEDRMRAVMAERVTEEVNRQVARALGIKPAALGIVDSGFNPPAPFEFAPPPGQRRFA